MKLSASRVEKNSLLVNLRRKALQSPATFFVAAAAFTKQGNLLGMTCNGFKGYVPQRRGAGLHAEQKLIRQFGKRIHTIYLIRVGHDCERLPIHACENCSKMANKLGIKIIPVHEEFGYKSTEIYP